MEECGMIISAQNISFWIGQKPILHKLSFSIKPGALTVVLGKNGAGKSTFLRILSGEQKPTMGRVFLGNQDLHALPVAKLARMRGVLSQQYAMNLLFSCEEIVMMGRYPHFQSQPAAVDRRIVQECMEEMQVAAFAKRSYQTLSGGEQQRVQMARVLAQLRDVSSNPEAPTGKLLLLDEPTSSMDCLYQQLCLSKARELSRKGYTVVVILHDLNLAAQFADQILLLKNGCMVRSGSVKEVLRPELIAHAYDMEIDILETSEYDFPILIPANHKIKPVLVRS